MENDEERSCRLLADEKTVREGFSLAVKLYGQRIYWKIRCLVYDHDDADDVLQNTFLKAWNALSSFQGNSRFLTWLYSIAINESLDHIRRNKKHKDSLSALESSDVEQSLVADNNFDGTRAQALLMEAVAHLPEVQRAVFTLKYFDNMKYSEISKLMNTSEGGRKASYHIAVKKITDYLKQFED